MKQVCEKHIKSPDQRGSMECDDCNRCIDCGEVYYDDKNDICPHCGKEDTMETDQEIKELEEKLVQLKAKRKPKPTNKDYLLNILHNELTTLVVTGDITIEQKQNIEKFVKEEIKRKHNISKTLKEMRTYKGETKL